MNYFRNLEEYKAYMSGKAEKLEPVVYTEPDEPETVEQKPKRSRKKKGDE